MIQFEVQEGKERIKKDFFEDLSTTSVCVTTVSKFYTDVKALKLTFNMI